MRAKLTLVLFVFLLTIPLRADPPELVRVIRNVRALDGGQSYGSVGAAVNVIGMSTVSGVDPGWQME